MQVSDTPSQAKVKSLVAVHRPVPAASIQNVMPSGRLVGPARRLVTVYGLEGGERLIGHRLSATDRCGRSAASVTAGVGVSAAGVGPQISVG